MQNQAAVEALYSATFVEERLLVAFDLLVTNSLTGSVAEPGLIGQSRFEGPAPAKMGKKGKIFLQNSWQLPVSTAEFFFEFSDKNLGACRYLY